MASNAKNEKAVKAGTFWSNEQQSNTYFSLYYEAVFAQISIKMYLIPSEPGTREKAVKAYLIDQV